MSDNSLAVWWVFVAGFLALAVILIGLIVVLVISHRKVIAVEREHARRLLEAQEAERAWVAREVHDDVLQRVAVLRSEVELLETEQSSGPGRNGRKLAALKEELDDLSIVLRSVAHRLHPTLVEQVGLATALHSLRDEVARSLGLEVQLEADESPLPLTTERGLAAYRIVQEALRNVARHSGQQAVRVTLRVEGSRLVVEIADRGRGFAVGRGRPLGIGLVGMQERATLAGGSFTVASEPGEGTLVMAGFPLGAG